MAMQIQSKVEGFSIDPAQFEKLTDKGMETYYGIEDAEMIAEYNANKKSKNIMEKLKAFITSKPLVGGLIIAAVAFVAGWFIGKKLVGNKKW